MRLITLIFLIAIIGCRSSSLKTDKGDMADQHRVYNCRDNWTFLDLADTVEIRLLKQDLKGRHSMAKWPNFYIGISAEGDTIGVVERVGEEKFKKNTRLKFAPYLGEKREVGPYGGLTPVFTISKKETENDLYCSVNRIYYGTLIK